MLPIHSFIMAAGAMFASKTIDNAHIRLDGALVLIFDNEEHMKSLDTRYCYNAWADKKLVTHMRRMITRQAALNIKVTKIKHFFKENANSYNYNVHYTYRGHPIADFCDRRQLIVITRVN